MADAIYIELEILPPIELEITTTPPVYITPTPLPLEVDPIFTASEAAKFQSGDKAKLDGILIGFGSKYSALDPGVLMQISIDDDFWYVCVEAGEAGSARWKRAPLKLI